MTLPEKILSIYRECPDLELDGYNEFVGYSYSSEREVKSKLKPLFEKYSILFFVDVIDSVLINNITSVSLVIRFFDIETTEEIEYKWRGSAYDQFGKGTQKAITAGIKSFLKHNFLLESGDDPDREEKKNVKQEKTEGNSPVEKLEKQVEKAKKR